jgi:hypothetical protein
MQKEQDTLPKNNRGKIKPHKTKPKIQRSNPTQDNWNRQKSQHTGEVKWIYHTYVHTYTKILKQDILITLNNNF